MKIVYPILFVTDTFLLLLLVDVFFKLVDKGMHGFTLITLGLAFASSVVLLVYIIMQYLKLPS